jgi:UTP-glucose-1-phosphate uridylyltransferase
MYVYELEGIRHNVGDKQDFIRSYGGVSLEETVLKTRILRISY